MLSNHVGNYLRQRNCVGIIKHNVFISYRRDGGEYTAKILRDRLDKLERIALELTANMSRVWLRSLNRFLDKEDDNGLQS